MEFIETSAAEAFGSLILIMIVFLVTIYISGHLKTWLAAMTAVRTIANLQAANKEFEERCEQDEKTIKQLEDQKEILIKQVAFEQNQLVQREKTIQELMEKIAWRDDKIKMLTDRIRERDQATEEFNRRLLKFLCERLSIGPEDIEMELGINTDGTLVSTKNQDNENTK